MLYYIIICIIIISLAILDKPRYKENFLVDLRPLQKILDKLELKKKDIIKDFSKLKYNFVNFYK